MLAVILAGIAVAVSGVTLVAVLVLLGRRDFPYSEQREQDEVPDSVLKTLIKNQKVLWYALEDMDDRLADAGLSVLRPAVPRDQAQASQRSIG